MNNRVVDGCVLGGRNQEAVLLGHAPPAEDIAEAGDSQAPARLQVITLAPGLAQATLGSQISPKPKKSTVG